MTDKMFDRNLEMKEKQMIKSKEIQRSILYDRLFGDTENKHIKNIILDYVGYTIVSIQHNKPKVAKHKIKKHDKTL